MEKEIRNIEKRIAIGLSPSPYPSPHRERIKVRGARFTGIH